MYRVNPHYSFNDAFIEILIFEGIIKDHNSKYLDFLHRLQFTVKKVGSPLKK